MICISCESNSFSLYSEKSNMNLQVYRCSECGLFVTGKTENEMRERSNQIYASEYWEDRKALQSLESNFTDDFSIYKLKHWRSQVKYCKSFLENKKDVLEIGSGAGQALVFFEKDGFNVTGIEPDARNVHMINQKLKHGHCIIGYVEDTPIEGMFDVIWVSHVFEHLIRPDMLLSRCKDNLRENGIIFIEVPECENPKILRESIHENPSTYHFTKKTLSNVAKNSGYKIIKCDSLRVPTLVEAGMMKILRKIFNFIKYDPYPYYPRIITNKNNGQMIRMILTKPSL